MNVKDEKMIGRDNGINHVNPVKKKNEKTLLTTDIGYGDKMKRIILISIVLVVTAYAAVDEKFATLVTDAEQRQKVITARAILQDARNNVRNWDAELKEIATSGSFNTVDAELKDTLIIAWQVIKDANDGFSDPNVAKLLDWRPTK